MTTEIPYVDTSSNFKNKHRYVLQGKDTAFIDCWMDSIYTATTIEKVRSLAPERAVNQPGLWRIVKSK